MIQNHIHEQFFAVVLKTLTDRGLILKKGTIVDSTIISAPSSTKNKEKKRDPDAHSVKKGTAWYFGYKAHIGVDKDSGLVHHVEVTSANVHDVEMTPKLMTGDESEIYGDSGYIGAEKRQDAIIRNRQGKKSGTSRIASQHRSGSCPRADNVKQRRRSIRNHLSGQR